MQHFSASFYHVCVQVSMSKSEPLFLHLDTSRVRGYLCNEMLLVVCDPDAQPL